MLFSGICLLELTAGYPYFEKELVLNPYLGAVYLGVPYVLYHHVYRRLGDAPLATRDLLLLFGLGLLSAVPCLATGRLTFAPALWGLAIFATVWRQKPWQGPRDGVVYGLAAALGFVTYYTHPTFIPIPAFIPLLGRFLALQQTYGSRIIWPSEGRWWLLLVASGAAASVLGWAWSWARQSTGQRRMGLLMLGPTLGMALLAACEGLV